MSNDDKKTVPESPVPLHPLVGSPGELSDFSRTVALEVYREWRDRIAAEDRRVLESLAMLLLQKRHVDGYSGRVWSANAHQYFSDLVDSLLKSMEKPISTKQENQNDKAGN